MTEYEEVAKLIYKKRSYLSRTKNKETAKRLEAEIAELMAKKNALPKPEHGKIQNHIRNYHSCNKYCPLIACHCKTVLCNFKKAYAEHNRYCKEKRILCSNSS